jgi:hypothetical protein
MQPMSVKYSVEWVWLDFLMRTLILLELSQIIYEK